MSAVSTENGAGQRGASVPTTKRFRPDLQGLRAVAVLAVVLYHAGVPHLRGGFVGVDVFFVLSGFLITGLLWDELTGTGGISLLAFYARRARRLLPAAVLVLGATLVAAPFLVPPLQLPGIAKDAASAALYSANYRFAVAGTDYLAGSAPPSPVQHFWSLGVEEQFYLGYPLLLLLLALVARRRSSTSGSVLLPGPSRAAVATAIAGAGLASLSLCIFLTRTDQPWAFYALPPRAWELAAGGLLALGIPEVRRLPAGAATLLGWAGALALLAAVVGDGPNTTYPGTAALVPVAAALALIASGTADRERPTQWDPARVLRLAGFQAIGAMSYSWYLWHWPVLVLGTTHWSGPLARTALVALGAMLSGISLRVVENPVRRAPVLTRSPRRSLGGAAVCTGLAITVAVLVAFVVQPPTGSGAAAPTPRLPAASLVQGTGGRGPASRLAAMEQPVVVAATAAAAARVVPANLTPSLARAHADKAAPFVDGCDLSFTAASSPPCVYGDPTGRTRIITFGDSHAAQWQPGLDLAARQQHWRLENLTKATCPPFDLAIRSPYLGREFHECEQWRQSALQRILAEKPRLVIIDVARHYGPEYGFTVGGSAWTSELGNLVRRLRLVGSSVLVFGATPKPPSDVPDCLSEHLHDVPACTRSLSTMVDQAGAERERRAVRAAGGDYVDVAPWICSRSRCDVVLGNLLVFRDDNHVTTSLAHWLSPVLTAAVQSALPPVHP